MKKAITLILTAMITGSFSLAAGAASSVKPLSTDTAIRSASSANPSSADTAVGSASSANPSSADAAVGSASSANPSSAAAAVGSVSSANPSSAAAAVASYSKPSSSAADSTGGSAVGASVDHSLPGSRSVSWKGGTYTVNYQYTWNNVDAPLSARSDSYGTFDVYEDGNGLRACYLHGADSLCSLLWDKVEMSNVSEDKAIGLAKATEIAKAFAAGEIADSSDYGYESYYYNDGVYYLTFDKKIDGYDTDDELVVWVTAEGDPVAFSAFYHDRYDKYKAIHLNGDSTKNKMSAQIHAANIAGYQLNKSYLTLSDNGKLDLAYDINYKDTRGLPERTRISVDADSQ